MRKRIRIAFWRVINTLVDIKHSFHLHQWEEEIAIFLLGVGGIVGLLTKQVEVAMFCFGAIAGYLAHGYQKASNAC
jgi:hypothetical protein